MDIYNKSNNFKFSVYQEDNLLLERVFEADVYNPPTRYFVDIRKQIPSISNRLQSCLSRRTSDLDFNVFGVETVNKYIKTFSLFNNKLDNSKLARLEDKEHKINEKTIVGVPCRFGLYINDNPIVERDFYVRSYNPKSRFSVDLYYLINEIVDEIKEYLYERDKEIMWEDTDIINRFGYSIQDIRGFSHGRRTELLKRIY
jgi:hypothetical protein